MSDLPIHVMPEDESDNLDIDLEVIDDIISSIFTSIDLQYRITKIMNNVDSSVIDTLISVRGQCYRVTEKLSRPRVWV